MYEYTSTLLQSITVALKYIHAGIGRNWNLQRPCTGKKIKIEIQIPYISSKVATAELTKWNLESQECK